MRLLFLGILGAAFLALAPACPPSPATPEPPFTVVDASSVPLDSEPFDDVCSRACTNLRVLACQEGNDTPACLASCRAAHGKLTNLHPECLAVAPSKALARACGSVRCP